MTKKEKDTHRLVAVAHAEHADPLHHQGDAVPVVHVAPSGETVERVADAATELRLEQVDQHVGDVGVLLQQRLLVPRGFLVAGEEGEDEGGADGLPFRRRDKRGEEFHRPHRAQ